MQDLLRVYVRHGELDQALHTVTELLDGAKRVVGGIVPGASCRWIPTTALAQVVHACRESGNVAGVKGLEDSIATYMKVLEREGAHVAV